MMVQTGAAHVQALEEVSLSSFSFLFLFARSASASDPRCGVREVWCISRRWLCGVLYVYGVEVDFTGLIQGSNLLQVKSNFYYRRLQVRCPAPVTLSTLPDFTMRSRMTRPQQT